MSGPPPFSSPSGRAASVQSTRPAGSAAPFHSPVPRAGSRIQSRASAAAPTPKPVAREKAERATPVSTPARTRTPSIEDRDSGRTRTPSLTDRLTVPPAVIPPSPLPPAPRSLPAAQAGSSETKGVTVACRIRPLNSAEKERGGGSHAAPELVSLSRCVIADESVASVTVFSTDVLPSHPAYNSASAAKAPETITFDVTYDIASTQERVFETIGVPALNSVLQGFNASIFAYGQTGSGKSHTMSGQSITAADLAGLAAGAVSLDPVALLPGEEAPVASATGGDVPLSRRAGLTPRLLAGLFRAMETTSENVEFSVRASFVEIYMERVQDLLPGVADALQRAGSTAAVLRNGVQLYAAPGLSLGSAAADRDDSDLAAPENGGGHDTPALFSAHSSVDGDLMESVATADGGTTAATALAAGTDAGLADSDAEGENDDVCSVGLIGDDAASVASGPASRRSGSVVLPRSSAPAQSRASSAGTGRPSMGIPGLALGTASTGGVGGSRQRGSGGSGRPSIGGASLSAGRPSIGGASLSGAPGSDRASLGHGRFSSGGGSGADPAGLALREAADGSVYVQGAHEVVLSSLRDVYTVLALGEGARSVAATAMNEASSRSHSIFQLVIERAATDTGVRTRSTLYLVDLAGSERVEKTKAGGVRLDEAKQILLSLHTLGNVINALTDGKSTHIPYRDSKLTRLLQDSLGGNARTALIITCSPSPYNREETLSSIKFGARAKAIKNKPKVNLELSDLASCRLQIARLREDLAVALQQRQATEDSIGASAALASAVAAQCVLAQQLAAAQNDAATAHRDALEAGTAAAAASAAQSQKAASALASLSVSSTHHVAEALRRVAAVLAGAAVRGEEWIGSRSAAWHASAAKKGDTAAALSGISSTRSPGHGAASSPNAATAVISAKGSPARQLFASPSASTESGEIIRPASATAAAAVHNTPAAAALAVMSPVFSASSLPSLPDIPVWAAVSTSLRGYVRVAMADLASAHESFTGAVSASSPAKIAELHEGSAACTADASVSTDAAAVVNTNVANDCADAVERSLLRLWAVAQQHCTLTQEAAAVSVRLAADKAAAIAGDAQIIRAQLAASVSDHSAQQKHLAAVCADRDTLQLRVSSLEAELRLLQAEVLERTHQQAVARDMAARLSQQLDTLSSANAVLQAAVDALPLQVSDAVGAAVGHCNGIHVAELARIVRTHDETLNTARGTADRVIHDLKAEAAERIAFYESAARETDAAATRAAESATEALRAAKADANAALERAVSAHAAREANLSLSVEEWQQKANAFQTTAEVTALDLSAARDALATAVAASATAAATAKAHSESDSAELAALRVALSEAEGVASASSARAAQSQEALRVSIDDLHNARTRAAAAESSLQAAEESLARVRGTELPSLQAKYDTAIAAAGASAVGFQTLRAERDAKEAALQRELSELRSQVHSCEVAANVLRDQVASSARSAATAHEAAALASAASNGLSDEKQAVLHRLDDMSKRLSIAESDLAAARGATAASHTSQLALEARLSAQTQTLSACQQSLVDTSAALDETKLRASASESAACSIQDSCRDLVLQLELSRAESVERNTTIQSLHAEIAAMRVDHAKAFSESECSWQDQLSQLSARASIADARVLSLQAAVDALPLQVSDAVEVAVRQCNDVHAAELARIVRTHDVTLQATRDAADRVAHDLKSEAVEMIASHESAVRETNAAAIRAAESATEALRAAKADANTALERAVSAHAAREAKLSLSVEEWQQKANAFQTTAEAHSHEAAATALELSAARDELATALAASATAAATAKAQSERDNAELAALRVTLAESEATVSASSTRAAQVQEALALSNADLHDARTRTAAAETALRSAEESLARMLGSELPAALVAQNEAEAAAVSFQSALEECAAALELERSRTSDACARAVLLEAQCAELQEAIATSSATVALIRDAVTRAEAAALVASQSLSDTQSELQAAIAEGRVWHGRFESATEAATTAAIAAAVDRQASAATVEEAVSAAAASNDVAAMLREQIERLTDALSEAAAEAAVGRALRGSNETTAAELTTRLCAQEAATEAARAATEAARDEAVLLRERLAMRDAEVAALKAITSALEAHGAVGTTTASPGPPPAAEGASPAVTVTAPPPPRPSLLSSLLSALAASPAAVALAKTASTGTAHAADSTATAAMVARGPPMSQASTSSTAAAGSSGGSRVGLRSLLPLPAGVPVEVMWQVSQSLVVQVETVSSRLMDAEARCEAVMRDFANRCHKVVELEMALGEARDALAGEQASAATAREQLRRQIQELDAELRRALEELLHERAAAQAAAMGAAKWQRRAASFEQHAASLQADKDALVAAMLARHDISAGGAGGSSEAEALRRVAGAPPSPPISSRGGGGDSNATAGAVLSASVGAALTRMLAVGAAAGTLGVGSSPRLPVIRGGGQHQTPSPLKPPPSAPAVSTEPAALAVAPVPSVSAASVSSSSSSTPRMVAADGDHGDEGDYTGTGDVADVTISLTDDTTSGVAGRSKASAGVPIGAAASSMLRLDNLLL